MVTLTSFNLLQSAPHLSNSCTTSTAPDRAAAMRGVSPPMECPEGHASEGTTGSQSKQKGDSATLFTSTKKLFNRASTTAALPAPAANSSAAATSCGRKARHSSSTTGAYTHRGPYLCRWGYFKDGGPNLVGVPLR